LQRPVLIGLTAPAQEFGWQPHTVRAAISGLRKAGLKVEREAGDTSPVYRIATSKAA
jgi:DNA-binding transcriptional regulator PaaX